MHTGLEEHHGKNGALEAMATFYGERAAGGAGLLVTGGVAPNREGWVLPFAGKLTNASEANSHRVVADRVHENGGKICMQILHAGRYAYHPLLVGPSKKKAPINAFSPRAMTGKDVNRTIDDFVRTAMFAKEAGYDGVEIMGSEGYLLNEFLAPRTNDRNDEWGGRSFANRARFPVKIASETRKAVGSKDFAIIFRLSLLELVDDGFLFEEAVELAQLLETAGVDVINTGIGWHEARVPTIATCVPRAAFAFTTEKLKEKLGESTLRLCATNRINDISVCESVLSKNIDLVSMARPFLADPDIVAKAFVGQEHSTNTCIACNQACLDHTFKLLPVSCLVNPRAGHETDPILDLKPTSNIEKIAVVGAGVAGLACSTALAARGFQVTLFEKNSHIGGQFNLAANVPGKEEFKETLRYFQNLIDNDKNIQLQLNSDITDPSFELSKFDKVVVSTGVVPRQVDLPNLGSSQNLPRVRSYAEVLKKGADPCGPNVAVIGTGGIGFDVSEFLVADGSENFYDEWGINLDNIGSLDTSRPKASPPKRKVFLLQRKAGSFGSTLGKTTGWIRRATLKHKQVEMIPDCTYLGLDDNKTFVIETSSEKRNLQVDDVVVCAGQLSNDSLFKKCQSKNAFVIGGAEKAGELDAKRAIDQGYRLAANIELAKPGDVFNMPTGWKSTALDFIQNTFSSSSSKKQKKKKQQA